MFTTIFFMKMCKSWKNHEGFIILTFSYFVVCKGWSAYCHRIGTEYIYTYIHAMCLEMKFPMCNWFPDPQIKTWFLNFPNLPEVLFKFNVPYKIKVFQIKYATESITTHFRTSWFIKTRHLHRNASRNPGMIWKCWGL